MRIRLMLAGAIASASLALPAPASAFPEGALLGHTGGFGEESCAACHFGGAQGEDIALRVDGPDVYAPGERYRFFVRVMDREASVAGFQLALRFEDGSNAGRLEMLEGEGQTGTLDDVVYASHTSPLALEDGEAAWELYWTAPDTLSGPVRLHAAAVSGADDQSPIGDNVHALTLEIAAESP